jgi:hypothetical protein
VGIDNPWKIKIWLKFESLKSGCSLRQTVNHCPSTLNYIKIKWRFWAVYHTRLQALATVYQTPLVFANPESRKNLTSLRRRKMTILNQASNWFDYPKIWECRKSSPAKRVVNWPLQHRISGKLDSQIFTVSFINCAILVKWSALCKLSSRLQRTEYQNFLSFLSFGSVLSQLSS